MERTWLACQPVVDWDDLPVELPHAHRTLCSFVDAMAHSCLGWSTAHSLLHLLPELSWFLDDSYGQFNIHHSLSLQPCCLPILGNQCVFLYYLLPLFSIVCMAWCDNKFVLPALPIAENLQRCNRALYTICKGIAAPIMMNGSWTLVCHDLAKRLSHYLYFFSFLFLFLWTYNYKGECGKVSRDFVTMSQLVWRMVTSQSQSQGVTWLE